MSCETADHLQEVCDITEARHMLYKFMGATEEESTAYLLALPELDWVQISGVDAYLEMRHREIVACYFERKERDGGLAAGRDVTASQASTRDGVDPGPAPLILGGSKDV